MARKNQTIKSTNQAELEAAAAALAAAQAAEAAEAKEIENLLAAIAENEILSKTGKAKSTEPKTAAQEKHSQAGKKAWVTIRAKQAAAEALAAQKAALAEIMSRRSQKAV
jgi:hypothetical protein